MWTEFFASIPVKSPATGQRGETVRAVGGFKRWKRWASFNHFFHLPVNLFQFALSLHCRLNEANCPSPLLNDLFSIDWAQNLADLPKIYDYPLVSSVISAAHRIFGRPRDKKDPECHPGDAESSCGIQNRREDAFHIRFENSCNIHYFCCNGDFWPVRRLGLS